MKNALILLIVAGIAWFAYSRHQAAVPRAPAQVATASATYAPVPPTAIADAPSSVFACDGRTMCSQMSSCPEATYFVQHCPNTKMDGDNDGVPCESQWCSE